MAGSQQRFDGSRILDPGFAGDDGSADPALEAALAAYESGTGDRAGVLATLASARLVVPVVAVVGSVEYDDAGLAHDKTSDMAAVLLTRPDGRRGLLAFTSTERLATWDSEARPVPVTASTAARAALQEQADALLLDVAGPVRYALEGEDLHAVAAGWRLARVGDRSAWIRPAPE